MDQWPSNLSKSSGLHRYWSIECSCLSLLPTVTLHVINCLPFGLLLDLSLPTVGLCCLQKIGLVLFACGGGGIWFGLWNLLHSRRPAEEAPHRTPKNFGSQAQLFRPCKFPPNSVISKVAMLAIGDCGCMR